MIKNLITSTIISLLVGVLVYLNCESKRDKIVVVDAIKLFNGFKMKIELEERDAYKLKQMARSVDSIENVLKVIQSTSGSEPDKKIIYGYQVAKANLQGAYEMSNREINDQVWKRLNVLIAEFGKKSNISIIVGANGMGSVLYNGSKSDLTDEAIQYVNDVYENKK